MSDASLKGIHVPLTDESEFHDLEVIGEIPRGLRGTYLRNGPNPAFPPPGEYHLWDGDGMIHGITFDDDGVSYRNRYVETPGLNIEREYGRALFGGMLDMTPPPPEVIERVGNVKNRANTNIVRHAGRNLALWEGGLPTVLTDELETLGQDDFAGKLTGAMTAHPKIDPTTGEMLFFGYSPVPPHLRYYEVDAAGKLVQSIDIDLPRGVMMHDFQITKDHVIFFDSPAAFDFQSFAKGGSMIRWAPEFGTRVGYMPRAGGADDIRWIELENCYVFHFLNGFERGHEIVITGASVDWMALDYEQDKPPAGVDDNSYLFEFVIDTRDDSITKRRIGDLAGEFCKIPDRIVGLPNRYGYLASFSTGVCDGAYFDSITKYDLERGLEITHPFGTENVVGEPCFAPDLEGEGEDDGFIVTYLSDRAGRESELIVLDARDIAAEPIARVKLPRRVPLGFHGNWIAPE